MCACKYDHTYSSDPDGVSSRTNGAVQGTYMQHGEMREMVEECLAVTSLDISHGFSGRTDPTTDQTVSASQVTQLEVITRCS